MGISVLPPQSVADVYFEVEPDNHEADGLVPTYAGVRIDNALDVRISELASQLCLLNAYSITVAIGDIVWGPAADVATPRMDCTRMTIERVSNVHTEVSFSGIEHMTGVRMATLGVSVQTLRDGIRAGENYFPVSMSRDELAAIVEDDRITA